MTLQIDPARTALVLLDYQNYNVHPDGYWAQAIPGSAERAAPAWRGRPRSSFRQGEPELQ